ncbi:conjugal transfer protein TraG [Pelagibacterium luteolum]|uniref:Type IV secretion system protein VirD4 n=1 Tax=Pelagibacterium luteolum TaxID=440168 RepID=A0A1G7YIN6_9HYPH|nr:conjugal transfer protein TraG [Pelagibacterium luteolum]SDG96421.1 type IV secretion system protein VirD4 [Pelagibacterium luteolum]
MSGTNILWGQLIAVFTIVLVFLWAGTQWVAFRLGFQPQLGEPWFDIWGLHIYLPPALLWWWYFYDAYAPEVFFEGGLIAAAGGLLAAGIAVLMSVYRAREADNAETFGSARWAKPRDIRTAGLLDPDGVVLGRYDAEYLRHDGPEHIICFAPTRSGKGVGLVVPSLLVWPGSAIVHDIKGENYGLTGGFRAGLGRVLLFDPTDPRSAAYNPLLEVRRGEWEVRDVQNIADILVDPEGSMERRNHWEKTSHSLLVGAILHVLYAEADKTLAGVASFLSDPRRPIESTLDAMMTTPHLGKGKPHPVVASAARELLNKSENERSGVLSTAMSFLGLYRDPVVAKVTSCCDWRIADLVEGARPTTLYLVVPPSDIARTKPLIRLILNQVGRRLTEDMTGVTERQRLLLMLDEFPALGRLDFFESSLAFMAGYSIKAFLITQSLNQVEKSYGTNNSILDNCHVRVAFATNDERTAKRVSDALGTATEMRAMKNYAGHRLAPWLGHLMVSRSETARPLLTPGEIMQLPPDEEIVMVAGIPPIRARKARYFADQRLMARIVPPPVPVPGSDPARPDDWSNHTPIPASKPTETAVEPETDPSDPDPVATIRQEPGPRTPEEILPESTHVHNEFDPDADTVERDVIAARDRATIRKMSQTTRQVDMNPYDDMGF